MSETCKYKNTFDEGWQEWAKREECAGRHHCHPNVCGRQVAGRCEGGCRPENEGLAPSQKACFWHCACEKSHESPGRIKRGSSHIKRKLEQALCEKSHLEGAFPPEAKLEEANLKCVFLPLANLRNATLDRADLTKACLWRADFQDSQLWNVALDGCDLRAANLHNADFTHADPARMEDIQLDRARVSRQTDFWNITWGRLGEQKVAEDAKKKGDFVKAAKEY